MEQQVNNTWLVKDRIILQTLRGSFNTQVSQKAAELNHEMLSVGKKPIHLIVDMQETSITGELSIKSGVGFTRHYLEHDNMGHLVVAGMKNSVIKMFVKIISGITKYEVFVEPSVEKAVARIKHLDNTLANVQINQ